MTPSTLTEGTVLATGALAASEIRQQVREVLEDKASITCVAPRDFVPLLAPKKALRVSSASAGRTATPSAASGGVAGETTDPAVEVAPAAATGGVVPQPGKGQGPTPVPPSASLADTAVQSIAPGGPPTEVVIDLDDEVEEERATPMAVVETGAVAPAIVMGTAVATEEREFAPAATTGTAAAGEARTPIPPVATKAAVVAKVGTFARGAAAKAAAAVEVEVPTPGATTGAGTPALVAVTKDAAATGTPAPVAVTAAAAAADGSEHALASTTSVATSTRMAVRVPGPSVRPAASGVTASAPTAASGMAALVASGTASTLASVGPTPKAWSGTTLRWMSRDDPHRPLFTLDDVEEWGKGQAVQGGLVNVHTALSSAMGELDGVVIPDGQRTGELTAQVAAAQQVINDLLGREQAAREDARRAEAKFQAVIEKAHLDREEFQDATDKARHDAGELARLKGEHEALQKTVERIRRERQKAW
ncbi:skin secretory protein xP2-like [Setaria italica]|uniref:skin secretory protein xP2-like n=1 Tax=Setaria italica TaxID=4555 RepID=UPI000351403B|nr:skin secretory protein xP2-like [Setaria italica]